MGFIISTIDYVVLIVDPMDRILVRWIFLRNNLEILLRNNRDSVPLYLQSAVILRNKKGKPLRCNVCIFIIMCVYQ